ncbi:DUF3325 domain-containing protein [Cupriavidus pauculus]|uniref:DUF3325 domain-containing protein n=1 Tax=Cupriavidus pauculus TaxID=82633 RepID=UPI001243DD4E|nr:DUF3325 domain-containing protein [Cupriavidus pauculus]KAB0602752.1 DUF3325 domain-containing protein [Cupriavidus pauculus]MCM3606254.1 DUF3325 domain-containing protein [Cupriavidus pauculus]UAL02804.1 DUF3325 domain-containing protein [Cupriavidus pauculus]
MSGAASLPVVPVWPACVAGAAFAVGGFIWLAHAIDRHHADLFGRGAQLSGARVARLRCQGALALALALAACVLAEGWAFGVIYWAGLLTVGALTVVGALTWTPHATPRLARASVAVGVVASIASPWLMQP